MSSEDERLYRHAVESGNFMAIRRAAILAGAESTKMQRLAEIAGEAADNGRRTLVYSQFLAVLDVIYSQLPGQVFGPLTGGSPSHTRQEMIDAFSRSDPGAVLIAQINAGGVGLNIQAASVVVICEPQVKPTMEWQAIARAHRMGQLESVQVHRLLSDHGIDPALTGMLARKQQAFDDFARISTTAESTPEAIDISDAELARQLVAEEQQRLATAHGTLAPESL